MKGHERQSGLKVVGRKDEKEEKGLENESASRRWRAGGGERQNQGGKAEGGDFQHHLVLKIHSL